MICISLLLLIIRITVLMMGLSRENWSYPPDQFWLPKMVHPGPSYLQLVLAGPNLATKICLGDHIWQLEVVRWTSLGCYKWSCFPILTAEKAE